MKNVELLVKIQSLYNKTSVIMEMSTAIVVLELLFTFVPYLLDTGVQIWNAVEVNGLTANKEFKYPTPLLLNEYYEVNTEQCEDDWTYFSHTKLCYKFLKNITKQEFTQLDDVEAYPASIHDNITNDFLAELLPEFTPALIGAIDKSAKGNWEWHDGTPWDYTNWGPGQPNGTSTLMMGNYDNYEKGQWKAVR